ncbi:MAG TPA: hypothetical protein VE985_10615 [Gaiellaceae bacterium]|nr:hypothetical protein [Gaiellaceae bacterium]
MPESLGEHTFARQVAALGAEPFEEAEQVTQAVRGEQLRERRRALLRLGSAGR